MTTTRSIRSISLALALLVSGGALAQPVSNDARRKAEAHFRAGDDYHRRGKYGQAVDEYLAAYDLAPLPLLLYNVAQAYRLKGDRRKALQYYEKYLAAEPNGRSSAQASIHADVLRKAIEAEDRADAERRAQEPPPPAPEPAVEPPPAPTPVMTPAPPAPVAPPPAREPAEAAHGGGGLRVAGIVTGAAGVVCVGVGVYFGLHARSLADEVADTYSQDKVDEGEAANRNMFILYGAGAAAIVTGGVLYWLGARGPSTDAAAVSVAPVLTPASAGLEVRGRF
jgi:tetratricopeptide (TPR) repeat protein